MFVRLPAHLCASMPFCLAMCYQTCVSISLFPPLIPGIWQTSRAAFWLEKIHTAISISFHLLIDPVSLFKSNHRPMAYLSFCSCLFCSVPYSFLFAPSVCLLSISFCWETVASTSLKLLDASGACVRLSYFERAGKSCSGTWNLRVLQKYWNFHISYMP